MLGLGISSSSAQYLSGEWSPSDDGNDLEAWYRNKVGITLQGETTNVSQWADQSGNDYHMVQTDTGEQPAYNAANGALTFDASSDTQNLSFAAGASPANIELDTSFVIGIKMHPSAVSTVVIGSNALTNEMFKIHSSGTIRLKNDGSGGAKDFTLDSGDTRDDAYYVIARDAGDDTTIYKDGVANPSSAVSVPGTFNIDAIGVRRTDTNPYEGTIQEIFIFKGNIDVNDLVRKSNEYLSNNY